MPRGYTSVFSPASPNLTLIEARQMTRGVRPDRLHLWGAPEKRGVWVLQEHRHSMRHCAADEPGRRVCESVPNAHMLAVGGAELRQARIVFGIVQPCPSRFWGSAARLAPRGTRCAEPHRSDASRREPTFYALRRSRVTEIVMRRMLNLKREHCETTAKPRLCDACERCADPAKSAKKHRYCFCCGLLRPAVAHQSAHKVRGAFTHNSGGNVRRPLSTAVMCCSISTPYASVVHETFLISARRCVSFAYRARLPSLFQRPLRFVSASVRL